MARTNARSAVVGMVDEPLGLDLAAGQGVLQRGRDHVGFPAGLRAAAGGALGAG
ncbi:hypothetical protein [Streptomyces sp. NPDC097610]|uniref:hypothetical protein n=1 Tax=Streptomyces sp. NPDC097610 TaxID=3157227 RepID=UPI003330050F